MSVGMPQWVWLLKFGCIVEDYFGHIPYQVGSSLASKQWRDVDVRLIMPDEEFERRFGPVKNAVNPKLGAITLAFCALGKEMTGLPIDFQIQPRSYANGEYGGRPRSALVELRPSPEYDGDSASAAPAPTAGETTKEQNTK
jgi:hypothetical protein